MAQTATTGNLENAQRIIIAASSYTEEHNAPALALIEQFSLPKGSKQVTVPKVGQMTMSDLVDGQDIIDEEDIGMTTEISQQPRSEPRSSSLINWHDRVPRMCSLSSGDSLVMAWHGRRTQTLSLCGLTSTEERSLVLMAQQ